MRERWCDFLASTEVVGGLLAITGAAQTAAIARDLYPPWQLFSGVAFGALAAFAGVCLLRRQAFGVELSALVQLVQIINVTIVPRLTFVALAGLRVRAAVTATGVHLNIGGGGEFVAVPWAQNGGLLAIGESLQITLGIDPSAVGDSPWTVAVNLAAVYFLFKLLRLVSAASRDAAPVRDAERRDEG